MDPLGISGIISNFVQWHSNAQATTGNFHFMVTTDVAHWQEKESYRTGQAIVIYFLVEELHTKRGTIYICFQSVVSFFKIKPVYING